VSESDLQGLSRADLDEVAESAGLDPNDYANKQEEIDAILAASGASAEASTEIETVTEEEVAEEAAGPDYIHTVDVADIGTEQLADEHIPLLTGESWVILGAADNLPDEYIGNPAAVLSSTVAVVRDDNGDEVYRYTPDDATLTVRERSQGGYFEVPLSSVQKLSIAGGRSNVVNFA